MAFPDPIAGTLLPAREPCELEVAFRDGFYCALLRPSFPRKAPYELWARGHEVLGNLPLWVWTVPPEGVSRPQPHHHSHTQRLLDGSSMRPGLQVHR